MSLACEMVPIWLFKKAETIGLIYSMSRDCSFLSAECSESHRLIWWSSHRTLGFFHSSIWQSWVNQEESHGRSWASDMLTYTQNVRYIYTNSGRRRNKYMLLVGGGSSVTCTSKEKNWTLFTKHKKMYFNYIYKKTYIATKYSSDSLPSRNMSH